MSMYCYVVLLQTLMLLGYDSFECFCSSFCLLFWRNLNLRSEVDLLVFGWHLFLCHNLLVFCRQVMILALCGCAFSILGVTFVTLVEGEFRVSLLNLKCTPSTLLLGVSIQICFVYQCVVVSKMKKFQLYNIWWNVSEQIGEPATVMICHQRNSENQVAWLRHLLWR